MTGDETNPLVRVTDVHSLTTVMPAVMKVMSAAFDPCFGEAWTATQCSAMLSLRGTALITAESQGQVEGFAMTRAAADEVELLLIAVDPSRRSRGVGARIVKAVCKWAVTQKATRLFLEVRRGNPAIRLYEAHGFALVGTRKDYYRGKDGQLHDALTMALALDEKNRCFFQ
jgi:[ribosomal protein S18]-alanine N-acetyltransferase